VSDVYTVARDLVAVPSHADPTAAGDRIQTWIASETGARIDRDDAGNVLAVRPPEASADAAVALVGHHDVVPPADAQVTGDGAYRVAERDGRLYGRGAADMKGALAAALCAFRDATPSGPVAFASFVGEERGGVGARHAIDAGFAPDRAVVVEGSTGYSAPGVTDLGVAHRGRREVRILAEGTAAHAAEAGDAPSAIYRACDAVDAVRGLDHPAASIPGVDRTITGSATVTRIDGGDAPNVTPGACRATVDERTVPGGDSALRDRVERIDGVRTEVPSEHPAMVCEDRAFADAALDAVRAVQGGAGDRVVKPHATDAGWLARAGTATLVIGPAERGEAHTDDESVALDALDRCRAVYRRLLDGA
jgi:acetylornithine deacetylase